MDTIDRAQRQEQITRDACIAGALEGAAKLMVPSGATHCDSCGDPIPAKRLEVIPAARHCTECAQIEGAP